MSLSRKDARRNKHSSQGFIPWIRPLRNRFEFWMNRRRINRDLHVSLYACVFHLVQNLQQTCYNNAHVCVHIFVNEASLVFRHSPSSSSLVGMHSQRSTLEACTRHHNFIYISVTRTHMHTCTHSPLYTYNGHHSFTAIHRRIHRPTWYDFHSSSSAPSFPRPFIIYIRLT